jgi:hypothetical protein
MKKQEQKINAATKSQELQLSLQSYLVVANLL